MNQIDIDNKLSTLENKIYFSIKEVSDFCDENASVLRYWEQEFFQLRPKKSNTQRRYEKNDIAIILTIKTLLREDRVSIESAKKHFLMRKQKTTDVNVNNDHRKKMKIVSRLPVSASDTSLFEIKNHLKQLLSIL